MIAAIIDAMRESERERRRVVSSGLVAGIAQELLDFVYFIDCLVFFVIVNRTLNPLGKPTWPQFAHRSKTANFHPFGKQVIGWGESGAFAPRPH